MAWYHHLQVILTVIQHLASLCGVLIIISGVVIALANYVYYLSVGEPKERNAGINHIRLSLGRTLILGLEFIVAADLIGTTTTPDYYALGMLAIIVAIRTLLTFSINREIQLLSQEKTENDQPGL